MCFDYKNLAHPAVKCQLSFNLVLSCHVLSCSVLSSQILPVQSSSQIQSWPVQSSQLFRLSSPSPSSSVQPSNSVLVSLVLSCPVQPLQFISQIQSWPFHSCPVQSIQLSSAVLFSLRLSGPNLNIYRVKSIPNIDSLVLSCPVLSMYKKTHPVLSLTIIL